MTGKAIAVVLCFINRKRGRAFIVKRAKANIVGTSSHKVDIVADHLNNVGGVFYLLDSSLINHSALSHPGDVIPMAFSFAEGV